MSTNKYKEFYDAYKQHIRDEQQYNDLVRSGDIGWYEDTIGSSHFKRSNLEVLARSEDVSIRRIALLDMFEAIAARHRAYDLRKLSYADYFNRRDASLIHDNETMDDSLEFFQRAVIGNP